VRRRAAADMDRDSALSDRARQQLHRVQHGEGLAQALGVRRDLQRAAGVPGHDGLSPRVEEVAGLALAQLGCGLRLHQVVDAGGAAAQLPVRRLDELQAGNPAQQLARLSANALGVGEVAGVVVGHLQLDGPAFGSRLDPAEELGDIAHTLRECRRSLSRLPERFEARGAKRGTVALLQGCVQRVFFSHVNEATARVLAAEGFEVHVPRLPRCCGALALHAGEDEQARTLAKATIERLERYETVIVNAAGCGSAMKDYAHVLRDEPDWAARAAAFAERVRDVSEFLGGVESRAERRPIELTVAYHDACHLAHAQGVRAQPRELLRGIPGLELVEPAEWELCCGSAGIYNLVQPEPAAELGERKARNLLDTGAEAVVAGNPGCALQITAHTERLGRPLPVLHPMELLARSIA
jgi:Fe-S oxidoreductase